MFASSLFAIVALALSTSVVADPNPLEPDSTSIFQEGGNCTIQWDKDATGTWTTMYIELMTGDNFNQVHLKTVATLDATTETTFSYTCPGVTPHSAIYFYKFTSPGSTDSLFTTRFTITGAGTDSAIVTPTATETASNGDPVAWGTGQLTDPSQGDEPPVLGNNTASASQSTATASPTDGSSTGNSASTRVGTSSAESHSSSSNTGAGVKNLPVVGSLVAGLFGAASMLFL